MERSSSVGRRATETLGLPQGDPYLLFWWGPPPAALEYGLLEQKPEVLDTLTTLGCLGHHFSVHSGAWANLQSVPLQNGVGKAGGLIS